MSDVSTLYFSNDFEFFSPSSDIAGASNFVFPLFA